MCVIIDPGTGTPVKPPLQKQINKYGPLEIQHTKTIDKFGPTPGLTITVTPYISVYEAELVPQLHIYKEDEIKDLESVNASDEEKFFFKTFTQWRKLVGTAAMSREMSLVDVQNLKGRPDWQTKMTALNKSIQQTMREAAEFYSYLDQTLDKPHRLVEDDETAPGDAAGLEK